MICSLRNNNNKGKKERKKEEERNREREERRQKIECILETCAVRRMIYKSAGLMQI